MNLDPDPRTESFRAEVRAWLAAHVPASPLPSVNTAEGAVISYAHHVSLVPSANG